MRRLAFALSLPLVLGLGCDESVDPPEPCHDASTSDSGTHDSGTHDSGTHDSGTPDSGTTGMADSGTVDPGMDSGTPDSGTVDPVDDCSAAVPGDGEGCAVVAGEDSFVVGEAVQFTLEFTVGPSGIPVGGGILVGIHHAAEMGAQVGFPNTFNYVTVDPAMSSVVALEYNPFTPESIIPRRKKNELFYKAVIARVQGRALAPGEHVQFNYGANAKGFVLQRSSEAYEWIRVMSDVDGDGDYDRLTNQPRIELRNAPATLATATARSQAQVGVPFEVTVIFEDQFRNVAADYDGSVSVHDELGELLASNVPIVDGMGKVMVAIGSAGPHRLRITSSGDAITGRSNPIRVYDTLPAQRLYFGDLHGHTFVSDGLGPGAMEYFRYGRDVSDLDFVALTDHGHYEWAANMRAVQEFYEPGEYVTILAQEASGGSAHHMNIYFRRDDTPHIEGWAHTYPSFVEMVLDQWDWSSREAFTGPHHFSYSSSDAIFPFGGGVWDERVCRFVEVYSAHGTSEYPGNPRPLGGATTDPTHYMQGGLAMGHKFAVFAASDNHDSKPGRSVWGRYPTGLAGIWTTALTRDAIWNALWDFRVYGTSADRIFMEYEINDSPMGTSISSADGAHLRAYVIGKTDAFDVVVIRDNVEIHVASTTNGVVDLTLDDAPPPGEHFYYLRVSQDNGERAWSTPIWVTQE